MTFAIIPTTSRGLFRDLRRLNNARNADDTREWAHANFQSPDGSGADGSGSACVSLAIPVVTAARRQFNISPATANDGAGRQSIQFRQIR